MSVNVVVQRLHSSSDNMDDFRRSRLYNHVSRICIICYLAFLAHAAPRAGGKKVFDRNHGAATVICIIVVGKNYSAVTNKGTENKPRLLHSKL